MDIAITTSNNTMYQVAKIDNQSDHIKFFVYNNNQDSDCFGKFVLIMTYPKKEQSGLYIETEDDGIVKCDLDMAVALISDKKDDNENICALIKQLLSIINL